MQITKQAITVTAATALAAAVALSPTASASDIATYSNAAGNVRCEMYQSSSGTDTICVSDTARKTQPECNPPSHLIPSVSISRDFTGTGCWNQGFVGQPKKLNPLQFQQFGPVIVVPGFSGNLYVFDTARLALIRAGSANSVIWKLR